MKKIFKGVLLFVYCLLLLLLLNSCADSKEFKINNKNVIVEPYGWFDTKEKNDSINYKINTGNIVLSFIFSETIVVPIVLTGTQLWEPVNKK